MTPAAEPKGRPRKKPRRSPIRLDRLRSGEAISLVAAIGLFVLMFVDWWEVGTGTETGSLVAVNLFDRGQDAWQALEVIPLFLMLAIVVAVGAAILRLSGSEWKPVIPPSAAVCVLGILAAVLILIRIISPPGPEGAFAELAFESTLKLPIFLALAPSQQVGVGRREAAAAHALRVRKRGGRPRTPPYAAAMAREICFEKAITVIIGLTPTEVGNSDASAT